MLVTPCMSTRWMPSSARLSPVRSATTRTAATSLAPSSRTQTRHPAGTETVMLPICQSRTGPGPGTSSLADDPVVVAVLVPVVLGVDSAPVGAVARRDGLAAGPEPRVGGTGCRGLGGRRDGGRRGDLLASAPERNGRRSG